MSARYIRPIFTWGLILRWRNSLTGFYCLFFEEPWSPYVEVWNSSDRSGCFRILEMILWTVEMRFSSSWHCHKWSAYSPTNNAANLRIANNLSCSIMLFTTSNCRILFGFNQRKLSGKHWWYVLFCVCCFLKPSLASGAPFRKASIKRDGNVQKLVLYDWGDQLIYELLFFPWQNLLMYWRDVDYRLHDRTFGPEISERHESRDGWWKEHFSDRCPPKYCRVHQYNVLIIKRSVWIRRIERMCDSSLARNRCATCWRFYSYLSRSKTK